MSAGFIRVDVTVPAASEELVTGFLARDIAAERGVEIDDLDGNVIIRFYLHDNDPVQPVIESLSDFLKQMGVSPTVDCCSVAETDWVKKYQSEFGPVVLDDVVIRPEWSDERFPDKLEIIIEPRMAFGTGRHETTQLCLKSLLRELKRGDAVLDVGTGSGILAIAAAKRGASRVVAVDIDIAAVENARENVAKNGVAEVVKVEFGSIDSVRDCGSYNVVTGNLIKESIFELFDRLVGCAKPGGMVILSGILAEQTLEVNLFLASKGYRAPRISSKNEWVCFTLRTT
jgi:ribosomal protein L11 methyltransferase